MTNKHLTNHLQQLETERKDYKFVTNEMKETLSGAPMTLGQARR